MKYKTTKISIQKFIKSFWRIVLLIHVKVPKLWLIHCYLWDKTLVNFRTFLVFKLGLASIQNNRLFFWVIIYNGFTCYMRKNINMKLYNTFIKTSFDNVYIHSLPFHGHRGRKWNTALASVFAYSGLFKHTCRIQARVTWLQCFERISYYKIYSKDRTA